MGHAVAVAVGGATVGVAGEVGGVGIVSGAAGVAVSVAVCVASAVPVAVGELVTSGWQLFSSTDTLSLPELETARSRPPSSLKSAATMPDDREPAWNTSGGATPPAPLPASTVTASSGGM